MTDSILTYRMVYLGCIFTIIVTDILYLYGDDPLMSPANTIAGFILVMMVLLEFAGIIDLSSGGD